MTETLRISVGPDGEGTRLDRFLASSPTCSLSRSRIKALLQAGAVRIGARTIDDANHRVRSGDEIELDLPPLEPATPVAQRIPLSIVYEDDQLLVIDKPAGLVVHPAAGHKDGTLVNALIAHCAGSLSGIGGVARPGIVHRLDKDTSGLLVVAKTDRAHRHLIEQFASKGRDGRLSRRYLALVWGVPPRRSGRIEASLIRKPHDRKRIGVVAAGTGRVAVTHYELVQSYGDVASLLALELETGRTHQIRVHMQHLGNPVVGDTVYGTGFKSKERQLPETARGWLRRLPGQALHAARLTFEHPTSGRRMTFEAPPPEPFSGLIEALSLLARPPPDGSRKEKRRK